MMTEPAPPSSPIVSTPVMTAQLQENKNRDSSAPSEPPGYFDTVPDSHVFFPPKYPTPGAKPSTAKSKESRKGIYSHDPILDRNPTELWRFLVSNLRQPHMAVHLFGTHDEFRTRTTRDSQGRTGSESYTVTITDFSFHFDVSKYVIPQWSRVVAEHRKLEQGKPMPTVRDMLQEYTSSQNPFKEFRLEKFVLWDFERVTHLLTDLVRSTGYRTRVGVLFPMQDYKVVALASNQFSRSAYSKVVRVLCVVSCLCIVFWPAWAIARKRMRLDCEYGMAVSADEFFSRNSARIHSAVVQRCIQEFMVAF